MGGVRPVTGSHLCDCGCKSSIDPDPNNYKILRCKYVKNYLILEVHYPDCTNFDGKKLMVFEKGVKSAEFKDKPLDPHFSSSRLSPIARFRPTEEGWRFALYFCEGM